MGGPPPHIPAQRRPHSPLGPLWQWPPIFGFFFPTKNAPVPPGPAIPNSDDSVPFCGGRYLLMPRKSCPPPACPTVTYQKAPDPPGLPRCVGASNCFPGMPTCLPRPPRHRGPTLQRPPHRGLPVFQPWEAPNRRPAGTGNITLTLTGKLFFDFFPLPFSNISAHLAPLRPVLLPILTWGEKYSSLLPAWAKPIQSFGPPQNGLVPSNGENSSRRNFNYLCSLGLETVPPPLPQSRESFLLRPHQWGPPVYATRAP